MFVQQRQAAAAGRQAGRQGGVGESQKGDIGGPAAGPGVQERSERGGRVLRESVCQGEVLYVLRARDTNGCNEWMMVDINAAR